MIERIQLLDDLGAELHRVAAEAERASRRRATLPRRLSRAGLRARTLAVALGIAVLLVSAAYAVPATRPAVDGVAGAFAGWVSGHGDDAPGRALKPGDDVPAWFREGGGARLIAKTEGVGLYVRRSDSDRGPRLDFGLGEGVGLAMGGPLEDWLERLDRRAIVVLGSALFGPRDVLDGRGRFPLLGLTAREAKRIELRYAGGPPAAGDTGDGRVLERVDLGNLDMRYLCVKEPGACPR